MSKLSDDITNAFYAYADTQYRLGHQPESPICRQERNEAQKDLFQAIFDAMVLQRELGREEAIADDMGCHAEPTDPVGRFIQARHDAENVINPNWVSPFVVSPGFLKEKR